MFDQVLVTLLISCLFKIGMLRLEPVLVMMQLKFLQIIGFLLKLLKICLI